MTRLPLPEPKKYFGIDAEPDFTYYTAGQMRDYADAEIAALREQVRVLRDALVMCSTAGDGLTLAQEAQIRAALKASK